MFDIAWKPNRTCQCLVAFYVERKKILEATLELIIQISLGVNYEGMN
jgi:hypothetical protein